VRAVARIQTALGAGPLASRSFRLLTAGQLASTVGDYCYAVALPWLVLSAHGGPVLLGTVLACYGVPRTALIPVGGILADRLGTRTIMLIADARCCLVAVLVAIAARHVAPLALLGPVAALLGAGEGIFLPASFAIMPTLLPAGDLQAGNALNSAAVQVGTVAGPVLGGLLVASAGSAPAFAVDAASFALSALSLALIRPMVPAVTADTDQSDGSATPENGDGPGPERAGRPRPETPPDAGVWPLLRQARLLQVIVVLVVAANFAFGGTFEVALPALAHARFGAGGYGALIACLGAGAVIGTLAAARGGQADRPALLACACYLIEALATAFIPFLGGLAGAAAAAFLFGGCNGLGNVIFVTLLQRWAPPRLLGRVMGLVMLAGLGSFPLSAAVTGVLVRHLGPSPFFPVAGAILAVAVLGALSQPEFRNFGTAEPPAAELNAEPA
jgi:MFS family permease